MTITPEQARCELARRNLMDFTRYTFLRGKFDENWHHGEICSALDKWFAREEGWKFLIFNLPPRHSKTEFVSRRLPSYCLGRCPDEHVGVGTYGDVYAKKIGRDVRRIMLGGEYRSVFPGVDLTKAIRKRGEGGRLIFEQKADSFEVPDFEGTFRAVGRKSPIRGYGLHRLIVDDPLKNRMEAESQAIREECWEWYSEELFSRQMGDFTVLVTMTRLHEDDLVGRLIQRDGLVEDGGMWRLILFRDVREEGDTPPVGLSDPRAVGDALWPNRYDLKKLRSIEKTHGKYAYAAAYRQRPVPKGERRFDEAWFRYYPNAAIAGPPPETKWYLAVDYAGSDQETACEAAILEHGIDAEGFRWFDRNEHGRWGAYELKERVINRISALWGTGNWSSGRRIRSLGLEKGAAITLKAWIQEELRRLGIPLEIFDFSQRTGGMPTNEMGRKRQGEAKLRIEALIVPYAGRWIWHRQDLKGGALEEQLLRYPRKPDDCADLAAYSLQQAEAPKAGKPAKKSWRDMTPWERLEDEVRRRDAARHNLPMEALL